MPVNIKVQGGVVGGSGKGLCATCAHCSIREDVKNNVMVSCGHYGRIRNPITRCTTYQEQGTVDLYALREIAWDITTDKKTGKVGFITPAERHGGSGSF